jgi:CheY-like chemotaxis protein
LGSDCISPGFIDPTARTLEGRRMIADGKQPHILSIDHTPEILSLLRDLLEDEGFRVTAWNRGDKRLAEIVALAPDLVTLDYTWSTVDDDWSFLRMLKGDRRTARIPVILCTGAVREVEALRPHLQTMGVAVVFKPFDIDQVIQAVRNALAHERAPQRMIDVRA